MKTAEAYSYIEVNCYCPECGAYLNILDLGRTKEELGSDLRANNCDLEITCPECGKNFIVSNINF